MPISYAPLWQTMKEKGFTTYDLKYKLRLGGNTYNSLKTDKSVTTHTIGLLCDFLDCEVQEVMCHIKVKPDSKTE